jgi:solute carrier family 25 protein 43
VLSGLSGSMASVLVTPLELSKLRMQVQRAESQMGLDPRFGYRNMLHGMTLIYQREGFLALYRGAAMRVLFSAPMTALSMSLTEYFRARL